MRYNEYRFVLSVSRAFQMNDGITSNMADTAFDVKYLSRLSNWEDDIVGAYLLFIGKSNISIFIGNLEILLLIGYR